MATKKREAKAPAAVTTPRGPHGVALLCCDYASADKGGKHNLLGIFNQVSMRPPDLMSPPFYVYFSIEGVSPEPLRLRLVAPSGEEVAGGSVVPDPNNPPSIVGAVDAVFQFRFEAQGPGIYRLELSSNGRVVCSTPLIVEYLEDGVDDAD